MALHKELAKGRWFELSLVEQLANVGMDVDRTIRFRNRGDMDASQKAFERALDLVDLTIADPKNRKRLKEVTRMRECLVDYFMYDNEYGSSDELWTKYFCEFNYTAALRAGR